MIAWGGASFAAALAGQNLIDEYHLAVQPVAAGSGHALFRELGGAVHFELLDARNFACGVVMHVYRPSEP